MCGIAGIAGSEAPAHQARLERMVEALSHRGPDARGTMMFGRCGLAHARLSIIDLSTGAQPMRCSRASAAVTFNGEIYGYKPLRDSLAGYPFRTTSDTEVILALYERDGWKAPESLPGMFAFAVWDDARGELLAARDRFGEKPFYYAFGPAGELIFASEIKSILASGLVRPKLCRISLQHYLRHLYVHPFRTIYSNIHVLPPAHKLKWADGKVAIERYWQLPAPGGSVDAAEAAEELRRLFEQAVERQLVADVPVGAFLSGGLDSSTVVAAAARRHPGIMTFSFDFEDSVSELPYARAMAARCKTDHHELADRDFRLDELALTMGEVYDEPFADSSNIPTYLISKLARRHAKVVLTGDAGDELLGGYSFWYRPLAALKKLERLPRAAAALLHFAARARRRLGLPHPSPEAIEVLRLRAKAGSLGEAHRLQRSYFNGFEIFELGAARGLDFTVAQTTFAPGVTTLDGVMRDDLTDYMPGDILVKTDRASMAHGLELRAPFLDVDFASFCISLPDTLKVDEAEGKKILHMAYERDWDPSLYNRSKQGFGAPVNQWLRRPELKALTERFLHSPSSRIHDILSRDAVIAAAAEGGYKTWILLSLAIWAQTREFDIEN